MSFGSGFNKTTDSRLYRDQLNKTLSILTVDGNVAYKIVEVVGSSIFTGESITTTDTSLPTWKIKRVITTELGVITEYANNGTFDQIWDNKESLFPFIFTNTKSLLFDAVNDHLLIGDISILNFDGTTPFSISAWFKTTDTSIQIISSKQGATNSDGWRVEINGGFLGFHLSGGANGNRIFVEGGTTVTDGLWHHVATTYDGSTNASGVNIYLDGVLETLSINNDTLSTLVVTTIDAQISGRNDSNRLFGGNIDEHSIWDSELSLAEILEVYNSGAPDNLLVHSAAANLISWYDMGDTEEFPLMVDKSINSNDSFMVNMTADSIVEDVP